MRAPEAFQGAIMSWMTAAVAILGYDTTPELLWFSGGATVGWLILEALR